MHDLHHLDLSNWCTRIMPRVSLPAEPASERKQGEWQAYFIGNRSRE